MQVASRVAEERGAMLGLEVSTMILSCIDLLQYTMYVHVFVYIHVHVHVDVQSSITIL